VTIDDFYFRQQPLRERRERRRRERGVI